MTYKPPVLSPSSVRALVLSMETVIQKYAREAYDGGYDDCLCDVIHFIQTGYWNSTDLIAKLKEALAQQKGEETV